GSGNGSGISSVENDRFGEGWNTFAGYPRCERRECSFEILEKHGFAVGYSETRRDPLWVAYRLFPVDPHNHDTRPKGFTVDQDTTAHVGQNCYRVARGETNRFDKGHTAPNSAIDERYGRDAQMDTFK